MRRCPAALAALALLVASCSPSAPGGDGGWQQVPLPAPGARLLVLTPYAGSLLALGSVPGPDGRAPAAWVTADARHWRRLATAPATSYGQVSEFVMAGVTGTHIAAYGQAFGGAHSYARPTLWAGDTAGLTEHEQVYTMFGGEDQLAVSAEAARPGTVLIVGAWDAASSHYGRYGAAAWTSPDGAAWTRHVDLPQLASAIGEQTSATGVTATGDGFLAVGSALSSATAQYRPLAWASPDGTTWQRTVLPAAGAATAGRVACGTAGCTVIGTALGDDQHLLCWATSSAGAPAGPPRAGPGHGLVTPLSVQVREGTSYVLTADDGVARLDSVGPGCSDWQPVTLPRRASGGALGFVGDRVLVALTGTGASSLWLRSS